MESTPMLIQFLKKLQLCWVLIENYNQIYPFNFKLGEKNKLKLENNLNSIEQKKEYQLNTFKFFIWFSGSSGFSFNWVSLNESVIITNRQSIRPFEWHYETKADSYRSSCNQASFSFIVYNRNHILSPRPLVIRVLFVCSVLIE